VISVTGSLTRDTVVAFEALLASVNGYASNARIVHIGSSAEYGDAPVPRSATAHRENG
jgi:hypothetical protein